MTGIRVAVALLAGLSVGCAPLSRSQRFIESQVREDPELRLVRKTTLYNVYYDKVIKRCVVHSAFLTDGNDSASAAIGIDTFSCDPDSFPEVPSDK